MLNTGDRKMGKTLTAILRNSFLDGGANIHTHCGLFLQVCFQYRIKYKASSSQLNHPVSLPRAWCLRCHFRMKMQAKIICEFWCSGPQFCQLSQGNFSGLQNMCDSATIQEQESEFRHQGKSSKF